MKNLSLILIVLCFSASVIAGSETGTVRFEWGQYGSNETSAGKTFFYLDGEPKTNPPSCATYVNGERWAINNDWPAARLQNSILLAAAISGKKVHVEGTGACEVWGDSETAMDVHIVDQ